MIPGNACILRITEAADTELGDVLFLKYRQNFFLKKRGLQT